MRNMRLLALVLTLLVGFSASFGAKGYTVNYSETVKGSELEFNLTDFSLEKTVKNGQEFTYVNFDGKVTTNDKGYAELPFGYAAVQLFNNNNVDVKVVATDYTDYNLDAPMLPSRGTIYRNQNPEEIPYVIDPASITDSFYPENITRTLAPYIIRDVRGTNVYVHMFRYNAEQQVLRVYNKITVELVENLTPSVNPITKSSEKISSVFANMYKSMFVNYNYNNRFDNEIEEFGTILTIYTSRDADAIQPWIQWKKEKGFTVVEEEVAAGTNVESLIQTKYDENNDINYVQLVGDYDDVKSPLGTSANAPMDPMMGCVVGTDNFMDIVIGRFSANSAADVTVQVDKSINYEKTPDMGATWYKAGIGIGSTQGATNGDDGEIDYVHLDVIRDNKLMPFGYTTVHQDYEPSVTASQVGGHVNDGVSIINYTGHGSHDSWSSSGFSNSNISSLTNGTMLPFIISVACVNGEFHIGGDCFAEAWLKKEDGGAIGMFASSINQPWQPPMRGQDYINDLLTGGYDYSLYPSQNGINTDEFKTTLGALFLNGSVLMYTEVAGADDLKTIQTWTVFGDASLQVRTDTPKTVDVSSTYIQVGAPYTGTITAGGSPAAGAMVSIYRDGVSAKGITDASGNFSIDHGMNPGPAKLVVTGYNLETIYQDVQIIAPTGPYLVVEGYEIVDGGNNEADYGETVDITLMVKNVGVDVSNNVNVTISSESDLVTINDDNATVASIAAGATANLTTEFNVTFANEIADQEAVVIDIALSDNSEADYDGTISIVVNAPVFELSEVIMDGTVDPGDVKDIQFVIENTGHAAANTLEGILTQTSSLNLTINNSSASVTTLDPGATGNFDYNVTFGDDIPTGSNAIFEMTLTAALDQTAEFTWNTIVGQIPIAILDLDTTNPSGSAQAVAIEEVLGFTPEVFTEIPADLSLYQSLFVNLGTYSYGERTNTRERANHTLSTDEGTQLRAFVDNGGRIYMEGGDTWAYDDQTAVHEVFGISGNSDGGTWETGELTQTGVYTQWDDLSFEYNGDNSFMDEITATGDGVVAMENSAQPTVIVNPVTKCVGSVFEFGGVPEADREEYMTDIIRVLIGETSIGDGEEQVVANFDLYQNYPNPFNPSTTIKFNVAQAGLVNLAIYNAKGERVAELLKGQITAGLHTVNFNASGMATGIYYYKLSTAGNTQTKKMLLIK